MLACITSLYLGKKYNFGFWRDPPIYFERFRLRIGGAGLQKCKRHAGNALNVSQFV